jgi:hypothetical protein
MQFHFNVQESENEIYVEIYEDIRLFWQAALRRQFLENSFAFFL